jgi:transcription termination factor Rho
MSAEQQLERSVLERKERDELHAIAEAVGLRANSRTKKGDLIDEILKATGVLPSAGAESANGGATSPAAEVQAPAAEGVADEPAAPPRARRTRAARPKAAVVAEEEDVSSAAGQLDIDGAAANGRAVANGRDGANGSDGDVGDHSATARI